jgi:hypothetical protein
MEAKVEIDQSPLSPAVAVAYMVVANVGGEEHHRKWTNPCSVTWSFLGNLV